MPHMHAYLTCKRLEKKASACCTAGHHSAFQACKQQIYLY